MGLVASPEPGHLLPALPLQALRPCSGSQPVTGWIRRPKPFPEQ